MQSQEKKTKERLKCEMGECKKIKGKFVLMKKNILDFNDFHASVVDRFHELHGKRVSLQLISSVNGQPTGELILTFLTTFWK